VQPSISGQNDNPIVPEQLLRSRLPGLLQSAEGHMFLVPKLVAAAAVPEWIELAESLPMLAVIISECEEFDAKPKESSTARIREYVGLKRRDVCGRLGFPSTNEAVQVMAKLELGALHTQRIFWLHVLREVMIAQADASELLARESRIGVDTISQFVFGCSAWEFRILYRFDISSLPNLRWFFRLSPTKRNWLVGKWLMVHKPMCGLNPAIEALFVGPIPRLAHFRSERNAWHHCRKRVELRDRIEQFPPELKKALLPVEWPEPPIPPTDTIQPIQSLEELKTEADAMQHCVFKFADHILAGHYYVYQMLNPVRATIGIRYDGVRWICDAVRGKSNANVADSLILEVITEWLKRGETEATRSERLRLLCDVGRELGANLRFPCKFA